MRLLFWIALFVLVFLAMRVQARKIMWKAPKKPVEPEVERMVSCAHCGLHFPAAEAITDGGAIFCGDEHRRLHSAR